MPRNEPDTDTIIAGRHPVAEVLAREPDRVEKVVLQQGARGLDDLRRAAAEAGVATQYAPIARLNRDAKGVNHQGVLAYVAPVAYWTVEDLLHHIAPDRDAVRAKKPLLLLLDQIEDPRNFGAILRSAAAAGVDGVVVTRHHMAPLNTAAVKASAGTATVVPIARVTNLADTIQQLKERAYWVAGADGEGDDTVWEMDWDRPIAIVMGSEGKGLRPRVAEVCDHRVAIPMRGAVESLNVSVAAGILLFAAARSR